MKESEGRGFFEGTIRTVRNLGLLGIIASALLPGVLAISLYLTVGGYVSEEIIRKKANKS